MPSRAITRPNRSSPPHKSGRASHSAIICVSVATPPSSPSTTWCRCVRPSGRAQTSRQPLRMAYIHVCVCQSAYCRLSLSRSEHPPLLIRPSARAHAQGKRAGEMSRGRALPLSRRSHGTSTRIRSPPRSSPPSLMRRRSLFLSSHSSRSGRTTTYSTCSSGQCGESSGAARAPTLTLPRSS